MGLLQVGMSSQEQQQQEQLSECVFTLLCPQHCSSGTMARGHLRALMSVDMQCQGCITNCADANVSSG